MENRLSWKTENLHRRNIALNTKIECRVCAINRLKGRSTWSQPISVTLRKNIKEKAQKRKVSKKVHGSKSSGISASKLQKVLAAEKKNDKENIRVQEANDWKEIWDASSGHFYFVSESTKQVTLDSPLR